MCDPLFRQNSPRTTHQSLESDRTRTFTLNDGRRTVGRHSITRKGTLTSIAEASVVWAVFNLRLDGVHIDDDCEGIIYSTCFEALAGTPCIPTRLSPT